MKKYRTVWMALLQWGLLWSLIIGCSLLWNERLIRQQIYDYSRHEATTVINKDLAFRRWATMHGGVYVHPTEQTPPNPWLTVPKRDVVTTDGDKLTLMNPAYMTRQVMSMFGEQFGVKGHITSLLAKNPGNAPDAWERAALLDFEKGADSVNELTTIDGAPYYRLILPMKMEQGCLKCHADTNIPVGGIRGGISAAVPLKPYLQAGESGLRGVRLAHVGIWLVGMIGITIASAIYLRQQRLSQQAEDDLRAQEALYASLTTASPTGVFQTDLNGACCYVNDRWSAIAGLSLEQARGDGWGQALHPDDREKVFGEWQQSVAEHRSFALEYRFKRPDGSVSWVYGQSAEIFDNKGGIIGYVGTVTDISLRKKVETDLVEQELFLRESQAVAHLGCWKSHPGTDMLYWTDELYRMMEHPVDEPISHTTCFRYFDPQDLPQVKQALEAAIAEGVSFTLNCRMISSRGRRFWVDFRCIGRLEGLEGLYVAGTMQDISEHKQIEELLTSAKEMAEATSRTKTELLATLSHELRTPLNGVLGGVQLLEMTELSDEQSDYLGMVRSSASNELVLVNDLLDLAGLEASGLKINAAPFVLRDSITTGIDPHHTALEQRGLGLTVNLSDNLNQQVVGDGPRLTQIVSSLLGNAIKFTHQGTVTISADTCAGVMDKVLLRLTVSDTGIGVSPADQERIFEPFVQVDMSNTRRFGGTGMGLAICRRIAERMGGSLRVSSKPGEGSSFSVELPFVRSCRADEQGAVSEVVAQPSWQGRPMTVLIAEDNPVNLQAAAGLVGKLGLRSLCAEDGKKALAFWMQGGIDVVLMDIQMPVMDGREATRFIRQREQGGDSHTPVIALTAHAMAGDRERLLSEGFDGYVAKPFQLQELAVELERVTKK
ncbi:MAG: ATP-binding protein [Trichlorobacter sp.]|uniref:ATP-binding protein n=1 Tax=Trichlorobacter sp. TaxID=2911007 RepID=UPI00256B2DDF|nr:ATP-binding protein [Trichlorobacter sp.]MDK9716423.1 ATP-binding protein [Trichlorobacter sp.]